MRRKTSALPAKKRRYDYDWSRANIEIAKSILRQGELRLDAQLKIALAADQRAMVSTGICAAFSAAITTASIANYAQYKAMDVVTAGGATAVALLISAALFLRCARPTKFKPPGNEPKEWFAIRNSKKLAQALGGEAENYQAWIEDNNLILTANAARYWLGVRLAMSAPGLGVVTFAVFHLHWPLDCLRLW